MKKMVCDGIPQDVVLHKPVRPAVAIRTKLSQADSNGRFVIEAYEYVKVLVHMPDNIHNVNDVVCELEDGSFERFRLSQLRMVDSGLMFRDYLSAFDKMIETLEKENQNVS